MIKIGIIGSGFGRYGLLPAFTATQGCQVVAIAGKKTNTLVAECKKYGLENIYEDWKEMLKSEELDAVAIAVTPRAQYSIAKTAIRMGLHVFAEKPLALTLSQSRELLRLAKLKKITHGVDFIFPEIPEWERTKSLIVSKKYGKLRHISVNWEFLSYDIKNKIRSWKTTVSEGGGALAFYFSHGLYYLENFGGKITQVQSVMTHGKESLGGAEVGVDMVLRFESGVTGVARVSCNSVGLHRHQLAFQCERGVIILENAGSHVSDFSIKVHTESGVEEITVPELERVGEGDARAQVVRKLTKRFVAGCSRKSGMRPSFEDGVRVQELITQVRKSAH
jgi:UDP-N-acetyl-2-amino-2-deoxyglucuronate dehydrogenase